MPAANSPRNVAKLPKESSHILAITNRKIPVTRYVVLFLVRNSTSESSVLRPMARSTRTRRKWSTTNAMTVARMRPCAPELTPSVCSIQFIADSSGPGATTIQVGAPMPKRLRTAPNRQYGS